MDKIEKYANCTIVGFVIIAIIPLALFMGLLAIPGYIMCKLLKINPDELLVENTDYE